MRHKKYCWHPMGHVVLKLIGVVMISTTINNVSAHSMLYSAIANHKDSSAGLKTRGQPDWGERHDGTQTVAGTRGCIETDYPLTPLVPKEVNWSLTTQPHPTFWIYVPYTAEHISSAVFVIDEETSNFYHEVPVTLSSETGFIRFTIPDSVPALFSGVDYRWTFKFFCTEESLTPIFVRGFVQFNAIDESHLHGYQTYLDQLIWLDAVNVLAMQRLNDPDNTALIEEWQWLLRSGGIGPTDVPIGPIIDRSLMGDEMSSE